MKIVQEGALTPLTHLLGSDDVEVLREVVACFCNNLAVSDENKLEVVKAGAVSALIALSQSSDMVVASQSCATLANLAELTTNQDLIANEGGSASHDYRHEIQVHRGAARGWASVG